MLVFLKLVRRGKFTLAGKAKVCTYLTEVAKNEYLKYRSRAISKTETYSSGALQSERVKTEEQDYDKLYEGLNKLDPDDREILIQFYLYDQTLKDIANRLNISYAAARQRIQRARTRLRNNL